MIRHMRVEEFEKLTRKQLRAKASECFAAAEPAGELVRTALLTEARFYLDELNRRTDSRVSIRDFILEIIVIVLIGGEIYLGIYEGQQQEKSFSRMQNVLSNLQRSSEATANTLTTLQSTTASMNQAIQKELGLFYDVSVSMICDSPNKRLSFINDGRTNVSLWGFNMTGVPIIDKDGRVLTPGTMLAYNIDIAFLYVYVTQTVPQGANAMVPFEVYTRNERKEEFVIHAFFAVTWENGAPVIRVQEGPIVPERWSAKKKK
jgi:hypothetical protein